MLNKGSLFITATATATGIVRVVAIVVSVGIVGREKFVNGKTDAFESVARVFRVATAFFCWYAKIVCGNKHLNITFELHNCENAERYFYGFFAVVTEVALKTATDVAWE